MHIFRYGNFTVFRSRLYMTNSTVVDMGKSVLICDPSWLPDEIIAISEFVQNKYKDYQKYLFISHFDFDHLWGWPVFNDAQIICPDPNIFAEQAINGLMEWIEWDENHYIIRPYKATLPENILLPLTSDEIFMENESDIHFFSVPGHTVDSFAAFLPKLNILLAGDYLSDVEIPWIGTNPEEYAHSLDVFSRIITEHKPTYVIPGHGDVHHSYRDALKIIEDAQKYINCLIKGKCPKGFTEKYISSFPFEKASETIHEHNKKISRLK